MPYPITPWWMDQRSQMQPLPYAAPRSGQPQPGMRTLPYVAPPSPPVTAAPNQGAPGQPPPARSLLELLRGGQGVNPITPQQSMAMGQAGLRMMGSPQQTQQPGQPVNPELAMFGMQRPFWADALPNTAGQAGLPWIYGQR